MLLSILKPTKKTLSLHAAISAILVLVLLLLPSAGFQAKFLALSIPLRIVSAVLSWAASFIYYPFTCGLVSLWTLFARRSWKAMPIVFALVLMAIFNPLTFAFGIQQISSLRQQEGPSGSACGLLITEFDAASRAPQSGLKSGDFIRSIDGVPVASVEDFKRVIAPKKPKDTVTIGTGERTFTVEVFERLGSPGAPFLGIGMAEVPCK